MEKQQVNLAFEMLLNEMDGILSYLSRQGAQCFTEGNYDEAKFFLRELEAVSDIRERIKVIRDDWQDLGLSTLVKSDLNNCFISEKSKTISGINEKDIQILTHLQAGMSNEEISQELRIAVGTTRNYISRIYTILEVSNRTEAVKNAVEIGLLQPIALDQIAINQIVKSRPTEAIKAHFSLAQREVQVLSLAENGLTNKAISEKMKLGEGTIRNYLSSCYKKLGVRNRIEAVQKAKQFGLLSRESSYPKE